MFNLDRIEQDWLNNCFKLTEEEIIEIFKSDEATIPQYEASHDEWLDKLYVKPPVETAEQRLMKCIYGDAYVPSPEEKRETERYLKLLELKEKKYPEPKRKHLSAENQKKVVTGSMHVVFAATREWYKIFNGELSLEYLYYICLESLIKCAKYVCHCGDPVFFLYVNKSIERNITDVIARKLRISFQQSKHYISSYKSLYYGTVFGAEKIDISLKDDKKEELTSPFEMVDLVETLSIEDESLSDIVCTDFIEVYQDVLHELPDDECMVMTLSYDTNGYPGLTYKEIADYMFIRNQDVKNIKKRALRKLRKSERLQEYL